MKTKRWLGCCWQLKLVRILTLLGLSTLTCKAFAQSTPSNIQPDNSLGAESSQVIQHFQGLPVEVIAGGASRGINLFHSFREFNVSEGRGAYFFSSNTGIQNILARVTGGNRSEILGRLGTFQITNGNINGSNANLFLINPNGILFGKNASLDINGSFAATTANVIQFEERGNFSATNSEVPQLLTINPSAFLFNQININALIQNNSSVLSGIDPAGFNVIGLRVPNSKNLLLIGGNIVMDGGRLNAYGGRIELGGLAEPGSINLFLDKGNLRLKFPENVARASVSLTNQAGVYVQASGGGNIAVNAQNIEILGVSRLLAGIGQGLGTSETVAGDITLNATGEIKIADFGSGIGNLVASASKGYVGNITIDAASFNLQNGAQIIASTFGQGNAGNVKVTAKGAVFLADQSGILSTVEPNGVGKSGNIDISAATLSIIDGAQVQTLVRGASNTQIAGRGDAGNVNVKVTGEVNIANVKNGLSSGIRSLLDTGREGNGGNITIDAGSFKLRSGAALVTSTFGQGNAGNVKMTVSRAISLDEKAGIFSTVEAGGVGKSGNIDINASTLTLLNGAQLQTIVRGASNNQRAGRGNAGNVNVKVTGVVDIGGAKNEAGSAIFSSVETGTEGDGGNITIDAGSFKLDSGAQVVTSTFGRGNAGNVVVTAKDGVSVIGKTTAILGTVQASGVGKGGNIDINAATLSLQDGAQLAVSTAGNGDAGNVTVNTTGAVSLALNAGIFSTVEASGRGKGGNININAATLSLQNGAGLATITRGTSDTQGAGIGDAGNVSVKVSGLVDIAGSKNGFYSGISSFVDTGTFGNGGNITVDAGSFKLSSGAQIAASTLGKGNAGNIVVSTTGAVSLFDDVYILSTVEAGGVGKGGNIDINATSLLLQDGAQIETITRGASNTQRAGKGDAGDVSVRVAGLVDIAGTKNGFSSGIGSLVETATEGNGGNISIDAGSFRLRDAALLDARTQNNYRGGDITVNANVFEALNGGQISTITSSNGRAGKIIINAKDKVLLSGINANYNERITNFPNRVGSTGANSGLFVSSTGSGITGDIEVKGNQITLDNQAKLNAESVSGNGGKINLNSNLFLLLRGSQITTNAGTAEKGGDGGNININSKFIVAIPNQNNDITANAYSGEGGNINIQSRGIFGIKPRTQVSDTTNDITASSQLGLSGTVNVISPDNSTIQNNLTKFPQNLIDANALIANSCIVRGNQKQEGSFTITGAGALPNRPGENAASVYTTGTVRNIANTSAIWKKGAPIVEPQGVYRLSDGRLVMSRECN